MLEVLGHMGGESNGLCVQRGRNLISNKASRIYEELVKVIWKPRRKVGPRLDRWEPSGTIKLAFNIAIVDGLTCAIFEEIDDREDAVAKTYDDTYTWIFEEEPTKRDDRDLWSSFPAWLHSKTESLYWITGKPGSAKSTLIKHILHSHLLKGHLQTWADGRPLHLASFFALITGSDLQKSLQGLIRTLLHQCLKSYPQIIPTVSPRRWALFYTLRDCQH